MSLQLGITIIIDIIRGSDTKHKCLFARLLDLGNGGDEQSDGLFLGAVDMTFLPTNLIV